MAKSATLRIEESPGTIEHMEDDEATTLILEALFDIRVAVFDIHAVVFGADDEEEEEEEEDI